MLPKRFARVVLTLVVATTVASCSGSSDNSESQNNQLPTLSDANREASEQERWRGRLVTSDPKNTIDGQWFCSLYSDDAFISRSAMTLGIDGSGSLDSTSVTWTASEVGALTLTSTDWVLDISNVLFSDSNAIDDVFDGTVSNDTQILCTWSGTPREPLLILSDAEEPGNLFLDEDRDPEIEGSLLTTLNEGMITASWICEMSENSVVVDYSEFQFFVGNAGMSVFEFNWYPISDDSIRIIYANAQYDLNDIRFTSEKSNRFIANDSRGFQLACDWAGEGRD